jgi:pimeloyl-ACP methyl ester carboxylesterase
MSSAPCVPVSPSFQHVSFPDYPLGGTSCRVVRHGTQTVLKGDFTCFDYGAADNLRRYGGPRAPSYRADFGLLAEAGVPLHIVAGAKDGVIPLGNIAMQVALLRSVAPALTTFQVRKATHSGARFEDFPCARQRLASRQTLFLSS